MKKQIALLTLFSLTSLFADDLTEDTTLTTPERIEIATATTITADNVDDYDGNSISMTAAVALTVDTGVDLTLSSADDSATFLMSTSNSNLNVYGDLTIEANDSGTSLYRGAWTTYITVYSGGSLTLEGDLTATNSGSCSLTVQSNATLDVEGDATLRTNVYLSGTLNVDGDLLLTKRTSSNGSWTTTPDTTFVLYDGASITGTNDIYIGGITSSTASGAYYQQGIKITTIDNDILKDMTINVIAGTGSTNNIVYLYLDFENSTETASGNVSVGTLELNNYNKICIDFLDNPNTGDSVTIEGITFGSTTTSSSATSTTIEFILTDFIDGILAISDTETTKITRDALTTVDNFDDGQYTSSSTVITVTETVDDTEYVHYVTITANDVGENGEFGFDGNYLTYTFSTVPEPSTYAMIFGSLALGLALYRRRK